MDNWKHKAVRIAITAFIFISFGIMFVPFFGPLLMAALFAFALDPIVSRWSLRRSKRRAPTLIIISLFFILIAAPIVVISTRVIGKVSEISKAGWQNTHMYKTFEGLFNRGIEMAESFGVHLSQEQLQPPASVVTSAGSWLMSTSTTLAAQAPELILALFVFSCAMFYFLTESLNIRKHFEKLDLVSPHELKQIIRIVQETSYITLVSTAIIGAVQATIVTLGARIMGYTEVLLIFVITMVTSFIPVIGAAPVAFVLALMSFLQDDVTGGIVLLIVAGIAGSIDNIIKPLILKGKDEDLNPIVSLLAIIGALIVYGLPGLLLGPILTRLAYKIIPILFVEKTDEPEPELAPAPRRSKA